jgi:hypothetical protein
VGFAFLLAAGLSYALSRRWNLIKAGEKLMPGKS